MEIRGVCLVKNEERYLSQVIRNAQALCNTGVVLDNQSTDRTPEIARESGWEYRECPDIRRSHEHVQDLAGKPVWIFGVDGDEVYSPSGLSELRPRLLQGEFEDYWMVRGRMVHVTRLRETGSRVFAEGYCGPPSPSVVNLYNFGALVRWRAPDGDALFFGRDQVFKPGYSDTRRYLFYDQGARWEEDPLRCLHLRFIRRSSVEPVEGARPNPWDTRRGIRENRRDVYRQGPLVTVDATEFFPQGLPE